MPNLWDQTAIAQGFWQGVFQLVALSIAAAFATFIWQRLRARYTLRQELIDGINNFAVSLYKPRKLYQAIIDQSCDPLGKTIESNHRDARRLEVVYRALEEVTAATGQFRALQVKIIPLYGHDLEIFAFYTAIWRYLKEVRHRMERSETLYFHAENPDSPDALYYLIDAFRYRVILRPFVSKAPGLARPAPEVLAEMRRRGDEVYREYFPDRATAPAATLPQV
jgi:hypothetical protein